MDFLAQYGLFLAQTLTVVAAFGLLVVLIAALGQRNRAESEGHIEVRELNDRYKTLRDTLREATLDPALRKETRRAEKKRDKKESKAKARAAKRQLKDDAAEAEARPRLFVLDFHGDLRASAVDKLREEISVLLGELRAEDEVVLRLESAGGFVHSYGLAASQLARIREQGARLTVAVDKIAASGGYMMACVAERIIAAPFAVIGSIGVLAQLPNFHRLLKKNDIDFELITAGEYKRTLTLFGENTDKGRKKFREDLEDTHRLFKEHVRSHRAHVDIDAVATGDVWFGQQALEAQLVDELMTSDSYILQHLDSHGVYELRYLPRKSWAQKLGLAVEHALERGALKLWQAATSRPPP